MIPTVRGSVEEHFSLLERLALPKLETPKTPHFAHVKDAPHYELPLSPSAANPLETQRDPASILASPRYVNHPIARYIPFVKVRCCCRRRPRRVSALILLARSLARGSIRYSRT